jgi:PAS domain S-box-containing protein
VPDSLRDQTRYRLNKSKIWITVISSFILLFTLIWLNEILDLPYTLLGGQETPANLIEAFVETLFLVLLVGIILFQSRKEALKSRGDFSKDKIFSEVLIQESPSFFTVIEAQGTTIMMNNAMLKKLGYAKNEVAGTDYLTTFVPEREHEMVSDVFMRIVKFKESTKNENHVIAKDGFEFLVEWEGRPVFKENGELDFIYGVGVDITERKKAETALRESERRYRSFVQNLQGIAFRLRMDHTPEFFHGAVEEITGYTEQEFLSGNPHWAHIVHPEDLEVLQDSIKIIQLIPHYATERKYRIIRKDSQIRWIHEYIQNICDDSNNPAAIQGMIYDITQSKVAEENLKESDERYRLLAENVQDVIWVMDKNLQYTYISPSIQKLRGYTVEEAMALPLEKIVMPASYEMLMDLAERYFVLEQSGAPLDPSKPIIVELEQLCKDNSTIWTEVTANFVLDNQGRPDGFVGITRNITERKKAEESLKASEESYRSFVQNLQGIAFRSTMERIPEFLHGAVEEITGFREHDFLSGKVHWEQLIHPDDFDSFFKCLKKIQSIPHYATEQTYRLIHKDSKIRWIHDYSQNICDDSGKPKAIQGMFYDITERKDSEEKLRKSEERYRLLAENIKDVIWVFDKNIKYTYISPSVERMRGYTAEETMAMPLEKILTPNSLKLITEHISSVTEKVDKKDFDYDVPQVLEVEICCKDGSTISSEITWNFLIDENDKHIGYVGVTRDISERKKVEKALLQSEQEKKTILNAMPHIVTFQDKDLTIRWCNEAAVNYSGMTQEDICGRYCYELWHEREIPCENCPILNVFNTGKRGEEVIHTPDNFWWEVTGSPLCAIDGSIQGAVVVGHDVTSRKHSEDALRESEQRYKQLFEGIADAVMVHSLNGRFLDCNSVVSQRLGYSREEFLQLHHKDIVHPDFHQMLVDHHQRLINEEASLSFESAHISTDGSIIPVHVDASIIEYQGEKCILSVVRDITLQKKAEESLRQSEEKYRAIFENTGAATFMIDEDTKISLVNTEFENLSSYSREEIEGKKSWKDFVLLPQDVKRLMKYHELRREAPYAAPRNYEFKFVDKHGTIKDVHVTATTIAGTKLSLGSYLDITELKRAEKNLRHSQEKLRNLNKHSQDVREKERTRVAREIHDELGQVLTALKMDLSYLSKKLPKDLEPLKTKTNLMLKFIDMTIQSVKRITMDLRPGLLDHLGLVPAIEWQAEEFQKRTGIPCILKVDPEDINLDRDQSTTIFRIFQETLTNVARHADATEVETILQVKDGRLEMIVKDNGKGITKKQIEDSNSFGLMGIKERAYFCSGDVKFFGGKKGGTRVVVTIPIESEGGFS